MIRDQFELLFVLLGFAASFILFRRFPRLPEERSAPIDASSVSVIIPARNEELTLPLILGDLARQTHPPMEILVVDDASVDRTSQVAAAYGARVIQPDAKPPDWTGKTWACQSGADRAAGELLLFLDADVRLAPEALAVLMTAHQSRGCTVSVQPFHRTRQAYEQLSLIFNLIQIGANGTALANPLNIGLYGPVILIPRTDYEKAGGHAEARHSIVEDMTLGQALKHIGLDYALFTGGEVISFRMYGDGPRSLFQGWTKNMATGAAKTPWPVFGLIFLWILSLASVPLHVALYAVAGNWSWFFGYGLLYIAWALRLAKLSRAIGQFQGWAFVLFPVQILAVVSVFFVSTFKKVFGRSVVWKGRAIRLGEKV